MKWSILIAVLICSGCDDTIPGICKVDGDCPRSTTGEQIPCRHGFCGGANEAASDSGGILLADDDAGLDAAEVQDAGFPDGGVLAAGDGGGLGDTGSQDAELKDAGLQVLGARCAAATQCASGNCADGVCCDSPCGDKICQRCDGYSVNGSGHCGMAAEGEDPDGDCPKATTSCSGQCRMLKLTASCTGKNYGCSTREETVAIPAGSVCVENAAVPVSKAHYCNAGDNCADAGGKCQASRWWTSCDGQGNCRPAGDKTLAHFETVLAPAGSTLTSSCGISQSEQCSASLHCDGDAIFLGLLCDGAGVCGVNPATPSQTCGSYSCETGSNSCKSTCSDDADCAKDNLCLTPYCAFDHLCSDSICYWDWEWMYWSMSPAPTKSLVVNADSTVTDNVTGLVWQREASAYDMTWQEARVSCVAPGLPGTGWRLPSLIELLSIVDPAVGDPAVDAAVFSFGAYSARSGDFWTSTSDAQVAGNVRVVSFRYGDSHSRATTAAAWVRCVR